MLQTIDCWIFGFLGWFGGEGEHFVTEVDGNPLYHWDIIYLSTPGLHFLALYQLATLR